MDSLAASPDSWHAWLEANLGRYLLFARSQARSEFDAHDLLQETLVEVWRREQSRPPDDALVFKTIRRRAIDLGRRTDRRARREQAAPGWWDPPSVDAPGRDAEIEGAVQTLPVHLREVVLLKIWGGLTFRQIADALSLPPATAASRYRYALEHLRNALKEVPLLNPDELEDRLRAVRPPAPPWELVLRLHAAEPAAPALARNLRRRMAGLSGGPWHPWRVAYAGVLAAWVLIAVLHLLTLPLWSAPAGRSSMAQAGQTPAPADAPTLDRALLLTRNNTLDPSWQ